MMVINKKYKMDIEKNIRRILREETKNTQLQDRLLQIIDSKGLVVASKVVGGIVQLIDILGEDNITKQMKNVFLSKLISILDYHYRPRRLGLKAVGYQYIDLDEIGEDSIVFNDGDSVITSLDFDGVLVHERMSRNHQEYYSDLPDEVLNKIFNIVLNHTRELENNK